MKKINKNIYLFFPQEKKDNWNVIFDILSSACDFKSVGSVSMREEPKWSQEPLVNPMQ